jgi:hypothetical protein
LGAAGLLSGYFFALARMWQPATLSTPVGLWQNQSMPRWVWSLIAGLLGVAVAILYGWVVSPVKFVDTTPASLREDFRTDYVLMVAESYHADQDPALASRRLAIFGSDSPAVIALAAVDTGQRVGYSPDDMALLQDLTRALQAYQPVSPSAVSTP